MIRKNYYKRITESIVKAYHDTNLDSAMEDGHEVENMGKKIVAIITADPDQDLDWQSEYEPFGATELSDEDEKEAFEHEGIETMDDECEGDECDDHELCPSCGYDVDCEGDDCEDDENDDQEDIMIGGGFESEDDDMEDMDVKDILVDILHELRGEDGEESEDEGAFETSDENPMFGSSSDDEESDDDDEWEDDDDEGMLSAKDDWSSEESDDDDDQDNYDEEEDNECFSDEEGLEKENVEGMLTSPENEEEVEIFDCLDNA